MCANSLRSSDITLTIIAADNGLAPVDATPLSQPMMEYF